MNWYEDPTYLRVTRENLGLTQLRLAALAGCKRSLVADLEAGRSPMTRENRRGLWVALAEVEADRRLEPPLSERISSLSALRWAGGDSPPPPVADPAPAVRRPLRQVPNVCQTTN